MTQPIADARKHIESNTRVDPETGCWLWTRTVVGQKGYGRFVWQGRGTLAHRVSYELHVGPVPDGLELDHLCREKSCVNPEHLEAVTHAENVRRGAVALARPQRETCAHGHAMTPDNCMPRKARTARPSYRCRACHERHGREFEARRKALLAKLAQEQA